MIVSQYFIFIIKIVLIEITNRSQSSKLNEISSPLICFDLLKLNFLFPLNITENSSPNYFSAKLKLSSKKSAFLFEIDGPFFS